MPNTTRLYPSSSRLYGLDNLRAFAIVIVLLFHYMVVVSNEYTFGYVTRIGWMGVDLFFVLSGYLIGNQVLSAIAKQQDFSLKHFYIRRLLRTLPNYYVVFALYFIFTESLTGSSTAPLWKFLSFTQNFDFKPGTTFSHSWSLCIEEQFYLIFPLIFLVLAKLKKSVALMWIALASGMLAAIGVRTYVWFEYGQSAMDFRDYYQHIYYSSFARFDELLPGIAIAMIKNFHPALFEKLLSKTNSLLIAGLILMGVLFYAFPNFHSTDEHGFNAFLSIYGYSLIAIGFGALTLSALSGNSYLGKVAIPGAAQLALWSYAIYLIHKPIFKLLMEPLAQAGIDVKSAAGAAIIMGASLVSGWLLFKLVETPFMNIRARFFPNNFSSATDLPLINKVTSN